jgi:hypothetical protein
MMLRLILIGLTIAGVRAQEAVPSAAVPSAPKPYVIQNGDVLDVRFFFNPELNEQNVQVRPDGCISLQIAGDVQLAGKTVEQARKDIEALFAKEVKTARVTIQIDQRRGRHHETRGPQPRRAHSQDSRGYAGPHGSEAVCLGQTHAAGHDAPAGV